MKEPKSKDISTALFQQFVRNANVQPKCPLCQTEKWSFISEGENRSYILPNINRDQLDLFDMKSSSVLLLVCDNCGYIAPILRERVVANMGIGNE